ncbi:MAG: 2'-5' RNA ligase [Planctomycetes bacterium GWF2_50_10]|nr:MAG: 2'-5' RNA ligase [Planctomycetes bacterium GWF2_50_10]
MRVFIAVDLSEEILNKVAQVQGELCKQGPQKGVVWVRPELMHLTLKFMGELEEEKLPDVLSAVRDVACGLGRFELAVENVGTFGRPAKVIWVGLGEGREHLAQAAGALDDALQQIGIEKEEREFAGHLTLGRVRDMRAAGEISKLAKGYENVKIGTFEVNALSIYKSQLTATAPIYTLLARYDLK